MSIKALKEKRAEVFKEMRTLRDKAADDEQKWEAVDEERWQDLNQQYDSFTAEIQREERFLELQKEQIERERESRGETNRDPSLGAPGDDNRDEAMSDEEARTRAVKAWMRYRKGVDYDKRDQAALRQAGIDPQESEIQLSLYSDYREVRAMGAVTPANQGEHTVPEGFMAEYELALLEFGGMREASRIIRTASGNDMPWPTTDDTGNTAAIVAEQGAIPETDVTTANVVYKAWKYGTMTRISLELLQDSAFNMATELGRILGTRIARGQNADFTNGTPGTSEPEGVITGSAQGKVAAANNAITADELIDLLHSVDPAYRRSSQAAFMMADSTLAAVRKLRDESGGAGTGQYLWNPSLTGADPGTLLGFPVILNQDVPAIATTAKSVLFGDFSKYVIRDVLGITLRRLVERYAELGQEGFLVFARADGRLLDAGTNPIKFLEHPV